MLDFSTKNLAVETIEQFYFTVNPEQKYDLLVRLLEREKPAQAIIFCRTKRGTDKVCRRLSVGSQVLLRNEPDRAYRLLADPLDGLPALLHERVTGRRLRLNFQGVPRYSEDGHYRLNLEEGKRTRLLLTVSFDPRIACDKVREPCPSGLQ